MKREHPNPIPNPYHHHHHQQNQIEYRRPAPPPESTGESSVWEDCVDGGMDELLAVLGYKVRSSDIADVAQRLEQLEDAICSSAAAAPPQPEDGPSDSVHYNPSELSVWLDSMLSDLGSSSYEDSSSSDYDLKAIPGRAVFADSSSSSSSSFKRVRTTEPLSPPPPIPPPQQAAVVVDSQENGIRLVHALMACAEAVQAGGLAVAEAMVKQINLLAASQAGAMRKVATYFAQALARRIYGIPAAEIAAAEASLADFLQMHFYESCPYLKFAHFTANQAILEAFQGKPRVHVIDFSMGQGMQWPALMQALALRPGGPPAFRLTGIGPPSHDNSDRLQEVGLKLAQLAETVRVEFEYRGFVANSLADLDAGMLELRAGEAVAVNSVFELHKLLARPGAVEKVLSGVVQMSPEIVTVVEQEASHNGAAFVDRFTEALHYYSTMFDSLEGSSPASAMAEVYLGKQIANVVACEGPDRVERHETMGQWRDRFEAAGFGPAHLGSNAFKQASMLLALYAGGDGYGVEEKGGCLTLGWHSRPLIATSAWKLRGSAPRLLASSH